MSTPSLTGYENLELIGKGGFSRVYKADQAKLKRKVAVKVLNFGLNEESDRISFARETELMGRVSTHPNIVTVHDTAFTAEGQPCIVMEHYPGGSLADLINEVGRLSPGEALEVGVAIASALEASHLSGVLHCDLKPQNILVSEFGQPALGDFGISTFAEERTRTGNDAGAGFTLPYAAPEIVEGESPSITSDVYSLAATLYTAVCGRRPFAYPTANDSKPTAAEQARRILLEPVPALLDEGVPAELDALLAMAMSKDPAERPASAALFARTCHEIGQSLGFGTSSPRIAEHGALPIIDSEAVGQGQIDLSILMQNRLEVLRPSADEISWDATARGAGFDMVTPEISTSRRRLSAVGGVLAVVIVGLLLFVATRGNGTNEDDQLVSVAPPLTASGTGTDPTLAPVRPRQVELERREDQSVVVSWQVPAEELESGDVMYEVRRQGADNQSPVISTTSQAVLAGVADDEGLCVSVLAVRSNRAALPTEPVCASPNAVDVELSPAECTAECEVVMYVTSEAPNNEHQLSVIDRSLADMQDQGFSYESTFVPAQAGTISVEEIAEPGEYLVVVTYPDGSTQAALFTMG